MACADVARNGPSRDVRSPEMRIMLCRTDQNAFDVAEGPSLSATRFARLNYPEYVLNYAEHRQLAVAVARSVASWFGSTNDIRLVHWEQPEPASSNFIDRLIAGLKGKWVTDEVIPLMPFPSCGGRIETRNETRKE